MHVSKKFTSLEIHLSSFAGQARHILTGHAQAVASVAVHPTGVRAFDNVSELHHSWCFPLTRLVIQFPSNWKKQGSHHAHHVHIDPSSRLKASHVMRRRPHDQALGPCTRLLCSQHTMCQVTQCPGLLEWWKRPCHWWDMTQSLHVQCFIAQYGPLQLYILVGQQHFFCWWNMFKTYSLCTDLPALPLHAGHVDGSICLWDVRQCQAGSDSCVAKCQVHTQVGSK